ncbi:MAG: hypothetical protein C4530_07795 [Desulfobacteraceae bacterium]|nr:MAG: hypothetical protein C4530_07795 [Desulfobacteraceae bacterium]
MQTTLFPSTYISSPAAELLSVLFGPLVIYQPLQDAVPEKMKRWEAAGRICIRIPVMERNTELLSLSKSYRKWAENHFPWNRDSGRFQAGPGSLKESSAFTIRDQIRRNSREDAEKSLGIDPLMAARLFLLFAQENDLQQDEIRENFRRIEEMETDLLGSLKGEPAPGEKNPGSWFRSGGAPDSELLSARRKPWSLLLAQDDQRTPSYVTLSKAAFEEILEDIPRDYPVAGFDLEPICIPVAQESVMEIREHLDRLAESAAKEQATPIRIDDFPPISGEFRSKQQIESNRPRVRPRVRLTLRAVRGKTPLQVFLPKGGAASLCPGNRRYPNTLIWHAELFPG